MQPALQPAVQEAGHPRLGFFKSRWPSLILRANSDRPAVPMERTPARFINPQPGQPEQQEETVEVLVSNERPGITPVFSSKLSRRRER